MRPPPDLQRKWAEINLQLNFLGAMLSVYDDQSRPFALVN